MEKVNITIGSVTFGHADYDADNDVLRLSVGEPNGGECEETPEMHVVRYAAGTDDILGLTIFNARARIEQDGHLAVTLPETSKMSAEDLASAFAAVETPAEASRRR
jgi:predicted RNA polymerase sigma factor